MEHRVSTEAGQAVYNPFVLRMYDWYVLGLSCSAFWQCKSSRMLAHYDSFVGRRHLDCGVGSGYFLDHARFARGVEITLFDLNPTSLAHARRRIERYEPTTELGDVLEPNTLPRVSFDSIGLSFLLHCLPAGGLGKWRLLDHLAPCLAEEGVLFGTTILGAPTPPLARQRWLMGIYNRKGIFDNSGDDEATLRRQLEQRFADVTIEREGVVALFSARAPHR